MKAKVSERGILIPKHYLGGALEADIRMEHGVIIVTPISNDPITQLGRHPVATDITDASEEHDKYISHQ